MNGAQSVTRYGMLLVRELHEDRENSRKQKVIAHCVCTCGKSVKRSIERLEDDAAGRRVSCCNGCDRELCRASQERLAVELAKQVAKLSEPAPSKRGPKHGAIVGRVYGRMTVAEDYGPDGFGGHAVKARCMCGNIEGRNLFYLARSARNGSVPSCKACADAARRERKP